MDSDLSVSMLALWVAVGAALGFRLSARDAMVTGLVYGSCLGFASTLYGYRSHNLSIERIAGIFAGVAVGALCGAVVTRLGAMASEAMFGAAKNGSGRRERAE